MNLEEAKANIGKEVMLDEKDHNFKLLNESAIKEYGSSYKMVIKGCNHHHVSINIISCDGDILESLFARPEEIKLKEQPMNYKIKVTPETSAEVQELFFELGFEWESGTEIQNTDGYTAILIEDSMIYGSILNINNYYKEYKEITLPKLRDIVVLKRNDVSDATHVQKNDKSNKYYVGDSVYNFNGVWVKTTISKSDISGCLKSISNKDKEMTWQDALRAVADGKEVEVKNISWFDINDLKLGQIKKGKEFRIKPQTIHIDGGDYTKEDLLKIAGEME